MLALFSDSTLAFTRNLAFTANSDLVLTHSICLMLPLRKIKVALDQTMNGPTTGQACCSSNELIRLYKHRTSIYSAGPVHAEVIVTATQSIALVKGLFVTGEQYSGFSAR